MDIYEMKQILKYKEELAAIYRKIIKESPEGSLVIQTNRSGNKSIYLHTRTLSQDGWMSKRVPISDEMIPLAKLIKRKQFCIKSLQLLNDDIEVLRYAIEGYKDYSPEKAIKMLGGGYEGILLEIADIILTDNNIWNDLKERENQAFPEGLKHIGPRGMYRSKSEVMIAMQLDNYGLNFKYEPEITLGYRNVYPDFVILAPGSGKIVYWEHAGMIDNVEYAENLGNKLREYSKQGINVGQNLIITTESEDYPLSVLYVEKLIRINFL